MSGVDDAMHELADVQQREMESLRAAAAWADRQARWLRHEQQQNVAMGIGLELSDNEHERLALGLEQIAAMLRRVSEAG